MLSAHAVCKTWRCQSSLEIKPILMAVLSGVAGLISYPWYGRDELWEVLRYLRPSLGIRTRCQGGQLAQASSILLS